MYPPVDPAAVRPGRAWFVIGPLIGAVGVGVGVALLVWGVATGTGTRDRTFTDGTTVTVRLRPAAAIWLPAHTEDDAECDVASSSGQRVEVTNAGYGFNTTSGGESWDLAKIVHVPAAGDYSVRCTGGPDRYAVGEAPRVGRFAGGIISFFGLGGLGLATTVIIVIVTAVRRSSHRNRLRNQSIGMPPVP